MDRLSPIDILAVGVHPDDVELGCIGTCVKQKSLGNSFGILDLTRGELGTRGTPEIRKQEAHAAASLSGASFRVNLNLSDGFLEHTRDSLLQLISIIRSTQPRIILANAIQDRHPDHGKAASFTSEAAYLSGLEKIKTTDAEGLEQSAFRPAKVYHYIQDYNLVPDLVVDVTAQFNVKIDCITAFKSQFYDPKSNEKATPISSQAFLDFVKAKARVYGRHVGAEYGEGFTLPTPIRVNNLFDTV